MYAIAKLSGKQFRIEPGLELKVPKQSGKVGDKIILDKVLFFDNDKNKLIGTPFIKDMLIEAEISSHGRDKKIIVQKIKKSNKKIKPGHIIKMKFFFYIGCLDGTIKLTGYKT